MSILVDMISAFDLASMEGRRPSWETALFFPDQGSWTETEYIQLDPGRHVEFANGFVELLPMPDEKHQAIVGYLFVALRAIAVASGGRVRFAPFPVRLWEEKYREPDLCFMRRENLGRCHGKYWEGADLAIEVLSDTNRDHDLVTKRDEYARAGIAEYWIVDPVERNVRVLFLCGVTYEVRALAGDGQRASSATLERFEVDVTSLMDAE